MFLHTWVESPCSVRFQPNSGEYIRAAIASGIWFSKVRSARLDLCDWIGLMRREDGANHRSGLAPTTLQAQQIILRNSDEINSLLANRNK